MMKQQTLSIMKNAFPFLLCTLLIATLLLSGCDNDDPVPPNEEELITTVKLTFQKLENGTATGSPLVFSWKDLDGSGPNAPTVENISLAAQSTYRLTIQILNESNASSVIDITEEIEEEGAEHQFFYERSSSLNMTIAYQDSDVNGMPIGLENSITTTTASNGTLNIVLRHEPNKNAAGVAQGDITNAGGETDVDVVFNVTIN